LYVKGATSYETLRTVNGVVQPSFEAAARELNLVSNDLEWKRCLQEAIEIQTAPELRLLFATICKYCAPSSPQELWIQFREHMADDIRHKFQNIEDSLAINIALQIIKKLLASMNITLEELNMTTPYRLNDREHVNFVNMSIGQRTSNREREHQQCEIMKAMLNPSQRAIFNEVERAFLINEPCKIYIHGPGGSGELIIKYK
jgi:hypothetical protein